MAKIVDLKSYRSRVFTDRAFGPWKRRFGEAYDETAGPTDLSDRTLLALAQPGEESTAAFYELIMGTLDIGEEFRFYELDKSLQLKVVDIHLFLADQTRFELMRRLGWVANYACQDQPLVELIRESQRLKHRLREQPPLLSTDHPEYSSFKELTARDRESFVRRLLPKALDAFRQRLDPPTA
jgi:hypothetical protein